MARFGQIDLANLFINRIIAWLLVAFLPGQERDDFIGFNINFSAFFSRPGNNQRRSRFIDKNGIHLINNGKA